MPLNGESQRYAFYNSCSQPRYPYEYGYNDNLSREKRIFVAAQGQNIYNLGGKVRDSKYRKPAPIGYQMDSSFDLNIDSDDDSLENRRRVRSNTKRNNAKTEEQMQEVIKKIKENEQKESIKRPKRETQPSTDPDQVRHKRITQFFNKDDFDPVEYLKNNTI